MGKKDKQKAAARARAGRATIQINDAHTTASETRPEVILIDDNSDVDCGYTGGVNYTSYSDEENNVNDAWESSDSNTDSEQIGEMEGEELEKSLQALKAVIELHEGTKTETMIFDSLGKDMSSKAWEKAESNRALGYSGNSGRSKRRRNKKARDQAEAQEAAKTSYVDHSFTLRLIANQIYSKRSDPQVAMMREMCRKQLPSPVHNESETPEAETMKNPSRTFQFVHAVNYLSDMSDDDTNIDDCGEADDEEPKAPSCKSRQPPPLKRQKLEVSYREQRNRKRIKRMASLATALKDIDCLIKSKKTKYESGPQGLQARRALTIQSYLRIVVKNQRFSIEASERAAESHGFAAVWGGRLLRSWTREYMKTQILPVSKHGRHTKVASLLNDPAIAAELRAFVRSNKWAMNPAKLAQLTQKELIPSAADKYLKHIVNEEIPKGLKRYLEYELFPRIQLKVARGISLSTARRWLHSEGFRYLSHKKGLYFDGHDRPDVVAYRQEVFLPAMLAYRARLVRYKVGSPDEEEDIKPTNYIERRLVLCPHDKSTSQANDAHNKAWTLEDQHQLRKKGAGRGLHTSGVITATIGYLEEATQIMEYGKNYEGYWTGELFVKQVICCNHCDLLKCDTNWAANSQLKDKIIPAFETAHGAGYQALFVIDNSQGHSAYAEDALVTSRMNVNPGGKQARMHNGWYRDVQDGQKITQLMVYPANHLTNPNQPKGIKAVLIERGLYQSGSRGKCESKCDAQKTNCCNRRILEHQDDFKEQNSLVQETIEAAGHLCIFLPKFHCELNYIEFFWGVVKKYLRDNCNYTFEALKTNLPNALRSVQLKTFRLWEHRMYRWMDAYREGLGTSEAQIQVRKFSSTKYKSHRRIPEAVACIFD
jgi:hypothetical protein